MVEFGAVLYLVVGFAICLLSLARVSCFVLLLLLCCELVLLRY